jgi:hypothetical protein
MSEHDINMTIKFMHHGTISLCIVKWGRAEQALVVWTSTTKACAPGTCKQVTAVYVAERSGDQ